MIKDESELNPFERLALQDLSYSRINTFEQCEARYFYSYVIKESQDFGNPALLGNIIHKALEITLENGQTIKPLELLENYEAAIYDLDPNGNIPDTMLEDGEVMLRQFVDDHQSEVEVYAKELPFSFILGPARFNGFIDYVSVHPTRVFIRDYKSGKQEVTYKSVPQNIQLGIYSLAMKKLFPEKEIYAELYYLRSGKAKGHLFTEEELEAMETKLHEAAVTILTKDHFPPTQNERACNWCDYAKNGVCPTGLKRIQNRRY